jgi:DNA-binding winged helix-turn-helix (wHTH) protein
MNAHTEVVKLLDQLRGHAKLLGVKARYDFESVSDTIETLTKAYMLPEVAFDWEPHQLSRTQARLAEFLRLKMGKVCTREQICNAIYAGRIDDAPGIDIVDVIVCKVRQKLRDTNCPYGIKSAWGEGYLMTGRASAEESLAHQFVPKQPRFSDWNGLQITPGTLSILKAMEAASPEPVSMTPFIKLHGRNSVNVRLHHLRNRLTGKYVIRREAAGYSLHKLPLAAIEALKAA